VWEISNTPVFGDTVKSHSVPLSRLKLEALVAEIERKGWNVELSLKKDKDVSLVMSEWPL
jgi:hypothetical protein